MRGENICFMNNILKVTIFLFLGSFFAVIVFFLINSGVFNTTFIFERDEKYQTTKFSLEKAPEESLKGKIIDKNGEILWQSRTATETSKLVNDVEIQQGEILETGKNGGNEINFYELATLQLFENSKAEIVQTLPVNLVFRQYKGKISYEVLGQSPISVRCINMLVNLTQGSVEIDVDEESEEVSVLIKNGEGTAAYNSSEFESKVWDLKTGDVFVYDSNERKGFFK